MSWDHDSLDERVTDIVVTLTKGTVGVVPGIGSILAEIVGSVVPNQRLDRIADFLRDLSLRLAHLERESLRKKLTSPDRVDILEDGMAAASRALTHERRRMLAIAYASVLSQDEIDHAYMKRVLKTINDLTDTELLVVSAIATAECESSDRAYLLRHEAVLRGPAYHFDRPLEEQEAYTRYESLLKNLFALQLINIRGTAKLVGQMSAPTLFEENGWRSNYTLSPLGKSVLALTREAQAGGAA